MKTPFEKEPHFENESSFRNPFWKWKHTYGKVRICKWQCTLIRGVIVIHPGLKYGLFHYTMVHFDHILSGVQISTIADFSSMHSGDFCLLLQISSFAWLFSCYHGFNLKYRTRAIITCGLYIFTPFFSAVYNQERFQIKSGL